MWPMLIEKAYAKMFTNYFSLRELSVQDVFEDLTGCPTLTVAIEFKHDQLRMVEEYVAKGAIVSFYSQEEVR